jgi:hypothetical protein
MGGGCDWWRAEKPRSGRHAAALGNQIYPGATRWPTAARFNLNWCRETDPRSI